MRRGDHEHSGSWDMGSCPLVLRIASLTQRPGVVAQWYSACQAGIRSGFGLQHRDGQRGRGGGVTGFREEVCSAVDWKAPLLSRRGVVLLVCLSSLQQLLSLRKIC